MPNVIMTPFNQKYRYIVILIFLGLSIWIWGQEITADNLIKKKLESFAKQKIQDTHTDILPLVISRPEAAFIELKAILTSPQIDSNIRAWAVFLTVKLPQNLVITLLPEITDCLTASAWQIRKNAANTLGAIKVPSLVDPLLCSLQDTEILVRDSVEEALEKILSPEDVERLAQFFFSRR